MSTVNKPKALRELLARPGIIVSPGIYDGLTARLAERAGFEVAGVSGAALTASALGAPDLGLLTMTEMLERVRGIVSSVEIPIMADAENGYGGVLNVRRLVQLLEQAGVAGFFIEDQTQNRRCGHFENKTVVPIEDMVMKIKAAVQARENPDVLIMARTDARDIEGLPAALTRARAYAEAGAEALFVESPRTADELREIAESLSDLGLPLKANMAEGGKTPILPKEELEAMGYKFAHFPGGSQKVAVRAISEFFDSLRTTGGIGDFYPGRMASLAERSEVLGLADYLEIESELTA
jgi:2-methylisocitrate lyase-like PEP mutase family enzyme